MPIMAANFRNNTIAKNTRLLITTSIRLTLHHVIDAGFTVGIRGRVTKRIARLASGIRAGTRI